MRRNITIVHVPYQQRGGEDAHVELLERAYHDLGFEVLFVPRDRTPRPVSVIESARSLGERDFSDLFSGCDLIHVHNAFPLLGPAFFRWAIRARARAIMTVHNHRFFCTNGLALRGGRVCKECFAEASLLRPIRYNCNSDLAKSVYHSLALTQMRGGRLYDQAVSFFLAPSPYIADELARFGFAREKIIPLLNPVAAPAAARAARYDVAFAGRLSSEKGIRELLGAAEHAPEVRFVIAGDGPERARIEEARLPNVVALGRVPTDQIMEMISESRIGVLPSLCNEICPTFVLECFSAGKRCVIARQDSTRWLAEGVFPGVLTDVGHPAAFASAIRDTLKMGALLAPVRDDLLRELGQERFRAELARAIEKVLAQVLS